MRDEGTLMSDNVAGRIRRSSRDSVVPPGLINLFSHFPSAEALGYYR